MKNKQLLEQEEEAFSRYRKYTVDGKDILASYWYRKFIKYTNMRKLAAALVKRELKANGITKLNTIKI